jgi:hypothetical protein
MWHGRGSGLHVFGAFAMSIAIIVVMLKLALETLYWVVITAVSMLLSLAGYCIVRLILSNMLVFDPSQYGVVTALLHIPSFFPAAVLCIVIALLPDFTFK